MQRSITTGASTDFVVTHLLDPEDAPTVGQRLTALKELWDEDGVLVENKHVVTGWDAVSSSVAALLKMLPPG